MTSFRFLLATLTLWPLSVFAQSKDVVDASEINKESTQIEVNENEVTDKEESDKKKKDKVERIEVTGSYVRRIDVEGPTPVVTITKEDFEVAGVDTVSDYLKESPLFSGSSDSGDRDGYFRFRGQHAGSTLVLLNGMRMPVLGGTTDRGFFNGVEGIPTNIIEKVEILKDGSSALYGSDAMAGVMNFITKKDYDGAEYTNRINIPENGVGLQQNHTIAFGKSYSNGSWFATAQFVEQRGYTQKDVGSSFQAGNVVRNSSSGEFERYAGPNGTGKFNGSSQINDPACGDKCEIDALGDWYIREPRQNIGTMLSGQIDINSDMNLNVAALYNRRNRTSIDRVSFVNLDPTSGIYLNASELQNNQSLLQKVGSSESVQLAFRPVDELGLRRVDVLQNAYNVQTQLRNYFADTWKWELGGSYGYTLEERDHRNGLVDLNRTADIIRSGYDPTNVSANNAGALTNAQVFGTEAYEASMTTARFVTTGEVFDFQDIYSLGGPASIAMGVEGQWESTKDAHDEILSQSQLNEQFGTEEGSRAVNSVFSEIVLYPLESLEFQAAGRFDQYSDWGETFNPKFSVGYRPSRTVLLRSSWGTNFKAPAVRNMIASDVQEFADLRFRGDGVQDFGVPVTRYRSDELIPEKGTNYNFGTVIQPNKMWTFTFDQWNFEGKDTITRFDAQDFNRVFQAVSGSPNPDDQLRAIGIDIERETPGGRVTSVRAPHVFNLGSRTIRGLDIGAKFLNPIQLFGRVLKFGFNFDHTHMLIYETQDADFLPVSNRQDLEWKNTMAFSLQTQKHNYRLAARTLAGDTGQFTGTRTHTEYDFNYGWSLPWWSARLQLGAKNILNTAPPVPRDGNLVRLNAGYNSYAFNPLGRRYYVGYSQSF